MSATKRAAWGTVIVAVLVGVTHANWSDSFDNGQFDIDTWQFPAFPDVTGTFTATIESGPDGNDYWEMRLDL